MANKSSNRRNPSSSNSSNKRKRRKVKRRRSSHKTLTVVTFIMLTIYLLGYIIVFANKPSVGVEAVGYGTIDVPVTLKGIIVRDEKVVTSTMEGQPYYNYSEGERAKKGAVVCNVKDEKTTEIIESELEKIDRDILEVQKSRSDISIFQDDIENIENNIAQAVDVYACKFSNSSISDVYELKNQVQSQINKRNEIWLAENTKSLTELSTAKGQYEEQLGASMSSITTDVSGIISFNIDKMEELFTPDKIKDINEEQMKMKVVPEFISKSKAVSVGTPVFKIVKSNIWQIVSYIPSEVASQWEVGDVKILQSKIGDDEKEVRVTIESMETGEKSTFVVFKTDKNIIDFINERTIEFNIKSDIYKGIKIPNEALVEKTFLKIPTECVIESNGENGVIKRDTSENFSKDNFIKVDIVPKNDSDFVYILQDFSTLKIGDTILKGTGENAETYDVKDISTYQGVFVVNSSVAKFVIVEVVAHNNDYAIVATDNSAFGLKVYDNIVSDAKSVEESDAIY